MKKGDIVTVHDFSWAKRITTYKYCGNDYARKYVVVEIDCSFPCNKFGDPPPKYRNNTIIRAIGSDNKILLIHDGFLRPVTKPVREVTMVEVCAQFGQEVKIKKT